MSEMEKMRPERFTAIQRPRRQGVRRPRSPVARYLEQLAEEQETHAANWSEERNSDSALKEEDEHNRMT